jgi:hypothetical protein
MSGCGGRSTRSTPSRWGEGSPDKAREFAAQFLAKPYREFRAAGHRLTHEAVEQLLVDSAERLTDLDAAGGKARQLVSYFKTFFALYNTRPALASWNNAIRIACAVADRSGAKGSRTEMLAALRGFLPVAHLWAAWCIRERKIRKHLADGYADFLSLLAEAEELRAWGQNRRQSRAKSKPPLPAEVWRVPEGWKRPVLRNNGTGRQTG